MTMSQSVIWRALHAECFLIHKFEIVVFWTLVAGSGLDMRVVRETFYSKCLPGLLLLGGGVFFLVYCCLTYT